MLAQPNLSIEELATEAGVGLARYRRLLRLSFVAPDIVEMIVDGRQPPSLTVAHLVGMTNIPLSWGKQRVVLGID